MRTTHGHHIVGTANDINSEIKVHECGGVGFCIPCTTEASGILGLLKRDESVPSITDLPLSKTFERLTPFDFINEIKKAPAWALVASQLIPAALELYIRDGATVHRYLTPDFISMPSLEVRLFIAQLNVILNDPDILRQRL